MARKSHRNKADVEAWIERQGYALERETAATLKTWGFRSTRGRHVLDLATGKPREIDLVADPMLSSSLKAYLIVECKASPPTAGAWIAREANLRRPYREWAPIMSPGLALGASDSFLSSVATAFPLGRDRSDEDRVAFSVVEATDETNDVAYDALRQAVDGANGWARESADLTIAVPVVVMDVPLFALYHAEGGDDPLAEVPWRRVLWRTPSRQTFVDVVTKPHLLEYAKVMREAFDKLALFASLLGSSA